ncbi:MAG: aspartate--tRNA ligase [Firmicutes bacterium]|nr:aspartate--tRNA ligase [Alicyclobacillaceae bacterium]MCL6496619.1 aspartate--tRNA ligase [Bacillota bacterium]
MHRTHYAAEVSAQEIGKTVAVAGWVDRRRDHGGLIFIDLRDRSGVIQLRVDPSAGPVFSAADRLRPESVIAVEGVVRARPPGMENPELITGAIEIEPMRLAVLSEAKTPPFLPHEEAERVDELVRLRYRYLDLRRPKMLAHFALRNRVVFAFRRYLHEHGFLEVETPALARSTPEGARDFLVPSRLQPGHFYALPQSPQLFKQLLMVAGFDRYYQVAKVFRDEDLRADRQPEFTQVDIEMSFVDQEDVLREMEALVHAVFRESLGVDLEPFPRLTWDEAQRRYGSDKPDLRAGPPLLDLTAAAHRDHWPVLGAAEHVAAVVLPGVNPSRRQWDGLLERARALGAPGLIWLWRGEDLRTNARALGAGFVEALAAAAGIARGDGLLVVGGPRAETCAVAGQLRLEAADAFGLRQSGWKFLWVTDFPLFEWSDEEGRWVSAHHPFTMPHPEDLDRLETDPARVRSLAYDVVLNGVELASGSMRIFQPELQARVFRVLGLSPEAVTAQFGFLLEAFQYGAPPHGGIAFGLDRLVMLMAGAKSLREVIAFPKTARGTDPLTEAPSRVDPRQLRELSLTVVEPS